MRLNPKLTWGLAWAGLALVVAVPSADFLTGGGNRAAVLTSDSDPVETATVTTTDRGIIITPGGVKPSGANAVDNLLKTGKKLPSYITESASTQTKTTTAKPAATKTATVKVPVPNSPPVTSPALTLRPVTASGTTEVASVPAEVIAPVPFPATARPRAVARPIIPVAPASTEVPLIIDESPVVERQASLDTADGPVPPANVGNGGDDWDADELRTYLKKKGMIDGASADGRSSASVTTVDRPARTYDRDGFYLSDGPNQERATRRARVESLFDDEADDSDSGFTLF